MILNKKTLNNDKESLIIWTNEDGNIHNNDEPAIVINTPLFKTEMFLQHGCLHRVNNPAIIHTVKESLLTYQYFFLSGRVSNPLGASIIKSNNGKSIEIMMKNNSANEGFNCYFKDKEKVMSKTRIDLSIKTDFKLNPQDDYNSSYSNIERFINSLLEQTETYSIQKSNKLPHLVDFYQNGSVETFQWLDSSGSLHRENTYSHIYYTKNKVFLGAYHHGERVDISLMPHSLTKKRQGKLNITDFKFKNKKISQFYKERNLQPFFLSLNEIKEVKSRFPELS